jgi:hypothetical protein
MKYSSILLLLALALASPACAQSSGGFVPGQVLTAAELNAALQAKTDFPNGNSLAHYGAACDGVTNDYTAIVAWLNATVAIGKPAYFSGTCAFATPIVLPAVDNVTIVGSSPGTSKLLYIGANTNTDIISIGTAGTPCCAGQHRALMFANWQLQSNTVMIGGAAMHFAQIVRSNLHNWWACTQDCANNFWHGVWFDQVDTMRWCGINAQAKQDVIRINGQVGGPQSDVWLDCGGKISGGTVGVRIGGAFGGFFCNSVDIIANGTNMWIDTSLTASPNFQFFLNPGCINDSAGAAPGAPGAGVGLRVSDTMATPGSPAIITLNGTWLASAAAACMLIDAGVQYPITMTGGVITNCIGNGITNNSSQAHLIIFGARIANITGVGVQSVVQTTGTVFTAADFQNIGSGFTNGSPTGVNCTGVTAGTVVTEVGYVTHC